jgi:hypothetical protein
MNIVIIGNNFQTLVDIVIVDSIHIDLVQCVSTMTKHVAIVVIQDKAHPTQFESQEMISFPLP